MSDQKFYVYEHWRPDRGECFYVGKGNGMRAHDMRVRNKYHKRVQQKLSGLGLIVEVRIIADNLSEKDAFSREIERIAFWKNDGADLCNYTSGGEGSSGIKFTEERRKQISEILRARPPISEETRQKLSRAAMGNQRGKGKKKPRHVVEALAAIHRGTKRSPETRARISAAKKGIGHPQKPETIAKIIAKQKGRPHSPEHVANMRGPKSEEHKRNVSKGLKAYFARKREKEAEDQIALQLENKE
jgi:hypothetical protein